MLTQLRGPVLLGATLLMGVMAGTFDIFAHSIMRGLGKTDDRTFIGAFQQIDKAVNNPLFFLTLMGALVLTGLAALLYRGDGGSAVVPWAAVAFFLYLAVFVITIAVHVPLNDDIKKAGDPAHIQNLAGVRAAFHEDRWNAWNVGRAVLCTVAFGCLLWALVLHGRIHPSSDAGPSRTVGDFSTGAPLVR